MYMIHISDCKLMIDNKKIRESSFISKMNNPIRINKLINKCELFISVYYSNNIIHNSKIKSLGLLKWFIVAVGYMVYINFNNYSDNAKIIIDVIIKIWRKWDKKDNKNRSCSTDKSIEKLHELFDKKYKNVMEDCEKSDDKKKKKVIKVIKKVKDDKKDTVPDTDNSDDRYELHTNIIIKKKK